MHPANPNMADQTKPKCCNATPDPFEFILRAPQIFILSLPLSTAATIQTNYGTGDGTTPGGQFLTNGNLLTTSLTSASRSGTFYREDSGYTVALGRLYDNALGPSGLSGLGSDGNYTVMPNHATIRFDLNGSYDIVAIRTYASWDDGRSGQDTPFKLQLPQILQPFSYCTRLHLSITTIAFFLERATTLVQARQFSYQIQIFHPRWSHLPPAAVSLLAM